MLMHMRTTLNIDDEILEKASRLTGVTEKTSLVRLGLQALVAAESSKRLARLALLFPFACVALPCPGVAANRHPPIDEKQACVTQSCHAASARAPGGTGSVHDPYSTGDCVSCHDLALTSEVRFVRGAPSSGDNRPESARAWDLALCSGCHGEGLLAPTAPAMATGFADGGRNLHALHVQAGRGRRCLPCHDPHAAGQPKLLREWIPARRGVQVAQQFRGEPQGGWCKTGCHAPKSYRR